MKMRRTALVGLLALLSVPALATIMVEIVIEDMVLDSQGVVRARVLRSGVQLNMRDEGVEYTTVTTLQVDEWLVGEGGNEILIREIGGEDARGGMRIAGTPQYRPGEEVIVILDRDTDGLREYFRTYGLVQGKFVVLRGVPGMPSVVMRDAEAVGFARWRNDEMTIEHGGETVMSLSQFVQRVQHAGSLRPNGGQTL